MGGKTMLSETGFELAPCWPAPCWPVDCPTMSAHDKVDETVTPESIWLPWQRSDGVGRFGGVTGGFVWRCRVHCNRPLHPHLGPRAGTAERAAAQTLEVGHCGFVPRDTGEQRSPQPCPTEAHTAHRLAPMAAGVINSLSPAGGGQVWQRDNALWRSIAWLDGVTPVGQVDCTSVTGWGAVCGTSVLQLRDTTWRDGVTPVGRAYCNSVIRWCALCRSGRFE